MMPESDIRLLAFEARYKIDLLAARLRRRSLPGSSEREEEEYWETRLDVLLDVLGWNSPDHWMQKRIYYHTTGSTAVRLAMLMAGAPWQEPDADSS